MNDDYSMTSLEWLRKSYESNLEKFDYADYEDEIYLDILVFKKESRGQGLGTMFMTDLCKHADKHKKIISLVPSNNLGTSIEVLEKFYEKFHFKYGNYSFDYHLMIRKNKKT